MKRLFLPVLGLLSLLLIFSSHKLHAAEIQVSPDTGAMAGVVADDGKCTLLEAVTSALIDTNIFFVDTNCIPGSSNDTIVLPAGTYIFNQPQFNFMEPLPKITGDKGTVTIQGAGARDTIIQRDASAADKFRIFYVDTTGDLTLKGVTVQNGLLETESGGAIYNGGTLTVENSQFKGNSAKIGGAIFSDNSTTLGIINSTFVKNTAAVTGGAVASNAKVGVLINNTFSENNATTNGGAIYVTKGEMFILHNTIYKNLSNSAAGGTIGVNNLLGAKVTIFNSLLADNQSKNCAGTFFDAQNNLDSGNTCGFDTAKGNVVDQTDAKLAALGDFGGSTDTHALMAGSPAIDQANSAYCNASNKTDKDQRGVSRPQGACDIGSYEYTCGNGSIELGEECDGGADCDSSCKLVTTGGSNPTGNGGDPAPSSSSGCSLVKTSASALNWMWVGMFLPGLLFVSLKKRKG